MCAKVMDIPQNVRKVLAAYPVRNPVRWKLSQGRAVVTYRKNLGRFETWLQKRIGGSAEVNRHLDDIGTLVWLRCDGSHTIADICTEVHDTFHEKAEPVPERVRKFLELLLQSGLVRLSKEPAPLPEPELEKRVKQAGRKNDRPAKRKRGSSSGK